jgi:hypothetical protein
MCIKSFCSILLLFGGITAFAQEAYFQQEVNYKISVQLDDEKHQLTGKVDIAYHNNAPNSLDTLYFHLWPNAYRDNQTAYARQLLRRGEGAFLFAEENQRGHISAIDFTINGEKVDWKLMPDDPDIALLVLSEAIKPGELVQISTPFQVQIPYCFSRLGHVRQAYQITQWYPKPAVYDRDGWHPMPYLDMGEFYSEFGTFDVEITLPDNYVVGATGVLQTPSEQAFLAQKVAETNTYLANLDKEAEPDLSIPPSSKTYKTIRYTAEKVHDFAWFADKRFMVQKDTVQLDDGSLVDTWALFNQQQQQYWKDAISFIKRSLRFYSTHVGNYPYPQATAVYSALGAGGGMEYPMITNCGGVGSSRSLDELIAHELGHNWFYGILASNERDHAWMDEGLNSYYDHKYSKTYYNKPSIGLPNYFSRKTNMSFNRMAYLYQARRNKEQAPDTPSDEFSEINYFLGAYEKPAQILHYLFQYVGPTDFDRAMQAYYQEWKFKHPQPDDFIAVLERELGESLDWLYQGLILDNARQDYGIQSVKEVDGQILVVVKNKGEVPGPFLLGAFKDSIQWYQIWVEGFEGEKQISIPANNYTTIEIDPEQLTFDINRKDNRVRMTGAFKKLDRPRIQFLAGIEDDTRANIYWLPALAWNAYDGFMGGLLLYNRSLPERHVEWYAAPMFGFGSKSLAGLGDVRYNFYPKSGGINKLSIGLNAQQFHFAENRATDGLLQYSSLQPYLQIAFHKPGSRKHQQLAYRNIRLESERPEFGPQGEFIRTEPQNINIHEVKLTSEHRRPINGGQWSLAMEYSDYLSIFEEEEQYLKASFEWRQKYHFARKRALQVRAFAGFFIFNTEREAGYIAPTAFNLISNGNNDYRFDDLYFGRNENSGVAAQQISTRDGGFKNVLGTGFNLGRSNSFIAAINIKSALPARVLPKLPIKPYFDIGYFENATPTGSEDTFTDQLLWSGGLMLDFFDETVAVYFPIVNSKNINDRYLERGDYWQRISFQVDLQRMSPLRAIDRLEF